MKIVFLLIVVAASFVVVLRYIESRSIFARLVHEMLLFRRNDMLVLFTAHGSGCRDGVRSAGCLATAEDYRYANSLLPAHQLEDRTRLHEKRDTEHAYHGTDGPYPWSLLIYLYLAYTIKGYRAYFSWDTISDPLYLFYSIHGLPNIRYRRKVRF